MLLVRFQQSRCMQMLSMSWLFPQTTWSITNDSTNSSLQIVARKVHVLADSATIHSACCMPGERPQSTPTSTVQFLHEHFLHEHFLHEQFCLS